ncbi:hypothetical protein HZH66_014340 [Vespula vulgaris]|uniref:Uncharacterized protein n=1 Tax=Vespula vulgaris TaxID=7454 RepID=A0A834J3B8_VESVU|nr:hypothetical protein HZH66_014340 [Vespula vulgaris]
MTSEIIKCNKIVRRVSLGNDIVTTDDPAKGSHSSNRAIVPQGVPLRDDRQKVNLKHRTRAKSGRSRRHDASQKFRDARCYCRFYDSSNSS